MLIVFLFFFFSSRRRHTRWPRDWSSDVCSSDLYWPPHVHRRPSEDPRFISDTARTVHFAGMTTTSALVSLQTHFLLRRSEEHTSELQSRGHLVCRLLLEKKKKTNNDQVTMRQRPEFVSIGTYQVDK